MEYIPIGQRVINYIENVTSPRKKEHNQAVLKMVNAIKKQHSLYRKEIKEWRTAQFLAKNPQEPRRKRLIDLYEEIIGDAVVFGRSETRKLRVSNKDFAIYNKDGDIDEEKTKMIQKGWVKDLIKMMMDSIYYGYSLVYPKKLDDMGLIKKLDLVFRDHIVPETCEVLKNPYDKSGARFDEGNYKRWCLFFNHPHSLGLLNKAAPLYIFKKHSWQNWDEFEEKFGIPLRVIKTASTDKRVLKEIDKWLKDLGSAGHARFPEGTELDIKETTTTDAFKVFNEKRKAANEEIATLFDGNSETEKNTGSRAKSGSIISSTQELITKDDESWVISVFNDDVLPFLTNLGYPFIEGDTFGVNDNTKLPPKERLEIFKGVKELGYQVKKEQVAAELDVELEEENPPSTSQNNRIQSENRIANFNKPHNDCDCGADYRMIDFSVTAALTSDEEKLLQEIYSGTVRWNHNEFRASHEQLLEALTKGLGTINIDYDADSHKMAAMMRTNVHRFGMHKTLAEISQLNAILTDPEVDSFEKFRERARKVFPNYKENWLKTEYQQAIVSAQMGARYQEMMEDIDIAPYWRLVAVLDQNTTTICRSLDGKVFRKDNPETWRFLPSNHFNCRSDAEDVLDNYDGEVLRLNDAIGLDPDGWLAMQKTGHNVNWGSQGQVFSATMDYLKRVTGQAMNPTDLTFKDFGLPEEFKNDLKAPSTAFKWRELLDDNSNVRLINFQGQPHWVNATTLQQTPATLVNALEDILQAPDEVYWFEQSEQQLYSYFKTYGDTTYNIVVVFDRDTPTRIIKMNAPGAVNALRKGLLIYNK